MDAFRGLHINLGIALAHAEGHGIFAARMLDKLSSHNLSDDNKHNNGQKYSQ